jgi:hypothetical protein
LEKKRRKSTQTNLQQINSTKKILMKKFKNLINKSTKNWSHMKNKILQQHSYNYYEQKQLKTK